MAEAVAPLWARVDLPLLDEAAVVRVGELESWDRRVGARVGLRHRGEPTSVVTNIRDGAVETAVQVAPERTGHVSARELALLVVLEAVDSVRVRRDG